MTWNSGEVRDVLPLTAADLDGLMCQCGCGELRLGAECHEGAGLLISYAANEKVLVIACSKCMNLVTKIKVAG